MARGNRTDAQRRRLAADAAARHFRAAVLRRDGFRCVYCGTGLKRLRLDHDLPVSRGGLDTMQNFVAACEDCDDRKGQMTGAEFRALPRSPDWKENPGTRP